MNKHRLILLASSFLSFSAPSMENPKKRKIDEIKSYKHSANKKRKTQIATQEKLLNNPYLLHDLCKKGDLKNVKLLINTYVDLEIKDLKGRTPLHLAAKKGLNTLVELLLNCGSDVKARDKNKMTPLHFAFMKRNAEVMTPLHLATVKDNIEVMKLLIARDADVDAKDAGGWALLHKAASKGCINTTSLLTDNSADVNIQTDQGFTPLHIAAQEGRSNVAQLLLDNGARLDITTNKSENSRTPLHFAAILGNCSITKIFLSCVHFSQAQMSSSFLTNNEGKKEVFSLNRLALFFILANINSCDKQDKKTIFKSIEERIIEEVVKDENILFYLPLNDDNIRSILSKAKINTETIKRYSQNKHLKWMQEFIMMKDGYGKTALNYAYDFNFLALVEIVELLRAVVDARSFCQLPADLKAMIDENIKKMLSH